MAEFCSQCAERLAFPYGDFGGMISEKEVLEGKGVAVLCEGCGHILVDHNGKCISADCLYEHGKVAQQL